jgi:peroxin-4
MSNRLLKEYRELRAARDPDLDLQLTDAQDVTAWVVRIRGPAGTPYEGGWFTLSMKCPPTYPLAPPKVRFDTPVFHPNVLFKTGEICLDILKADSWTPAWTLQSVCRAIAALLADPEADSPLNCDAGNLVRNGDMRGYRSMARMYTQLHAQRSDGASSSADR